MKYSNDRDVFSFDALKTINRADARRLKALVLLLDPTAVCNLPALRESIRRGVTSVFILRHRSKIAATATAVRFSTPTGTHCRIEDVVVDERFRGRGLGRQIMEQTLDALMAADVKSIELTSRPSRRAANALYRKLGFKRHMTNVYKLLAPPPASRKRPTAY